MMGEKPGDVELSSVKQDPSQKAEFQQKRHHRSRRRCACLACCGCCGVLLVIIALVLIILAFTVFKPKKPKLHVDHVTVEDFDANIELNIPPSLSLNITLGLFVSVKNPNKAAFRFYNSTASVFYRDIEVGSMPISAGYLGAGGTTQISSSLKLFVDRLLSDKRFYADFIADSLLFSTTARIGGKVNFLKIIKHHVDTSTVCQVTIIPSRIKKGLHDLECMYDIDL